MQNYHVSAAGTSVLLGNQTASLSEIESLPWVELLHHEDNSDVLDNLDKIASIYEPFITHNSAMSYAPVEMSSDQNQISTSHANMPSQTVDHIVYQTSHLQSSVQQTASTGYATNPANNLPTPDCHQANQLSYNPVTSQQNVDEQRNHQIVGENGQPYTFNIFDYTNFRYQQHQNDVVVTQQPQSSVTQIESGSENLIHSSRAHPQVVNQPHSSAHHDYGLQVQSSVNQCSDEEPPVSTMSLLQSAMNEAQIIPQPMNSQPMPQSSENSQPMPQSSIHSQTGPQYSMDSQLMPQSSIHSQTGPQYSMDSQLMPQSSMNSQSMPPSSMNSQSMPPSSMNSQSMPPSSINSQSMPPSSIYSQSMPQSSMNSQSMPQSSIYSQSMPPSSMHYQPMSQSSINSQSMPQFSTNSQPMPQSSVKQPQVAAHSLPAVLNKVQCVSQPVPIRVPHPSHLISPLLAQSKHQLPSGLRNSNYLVHPIIARPSSQPPSADQESKGNDDEKNESTQIQQSTKFESGREENTISSSEADNALQRQLNLYAQRSLSVGFQDQQTSYDKVGDNNIQTPDFQTSSTQQPVHSTEFLLQGGRAAPEGPESRVQQPITSHTSQSSSSDSSEDDAEKLNTTAPSEISSDEAEEQLTPDNQQQHSQTPPVNFWEQHTAASRIASSGVAHPKPVRPSAGYPSMFPTSTFPWANSNIYHQPFHSTFQSALPVVQPDSKQEIGTSLSHDHLTPQPQEPPSHFATQQPKEQQRNHSDNLNELLNDFPKSLESLSALHTSQAAASWPSSHQRPQDSTSVSAVSHTSNTTVESKETAPQNGGMFSNNTFMSPSFFSQHALGRSSMTMPPLSSTPEATPSPTNSKASDDDSAIDVNPGSSSISPSSSIDSRSSPELMSLHLQNEDSNSSVNEPSLLMSRSSSVSSICDSSISSTASSSNSSFGVQRGKRPNPDPDMGNYKKKSRTSYTPGQLRALERVYMENPYPECDTIDRLARELDIPDQRLRVWFQNKRARMRRQAKQNKQTAPHPPVNPYNAQPMSAIMSSGAPYSFLPPNSMMAPGQTTQMMQRPYFPYPQGAPGPMMPHPGTMSSAPGMPQHPPPLLSQQSLPLTPQQSQIQRLYSFIAHKNQN